MKKAFFSPLASLLLMAILGLAACQKSDNGGGGNTSETYATTPCTNTNLATCGNGNISGYNYGNIQFMNYQGAYSNGFCGCLGGFRPIIHPTMGLSCASSSFFRPYQNTGMGLWGYSYSVFNNNYYSGGAYNGGYYGNTNSSGGITSQPGQNNQWSSIPQVTYNPAIAGSNNNCYANAAATCDIRQANSCGTSGVCRTTGGGTYLGICSYQRGTEGYSQANPCIQRMRNGGYINICGYNGSSYGYNNNSYGGNLPVR